MWSPVGNDILTSLFFRVKLKILKGKWIRDLNGFGNTQHANNPLNTPTLQKLTEALKNGKQSNLSKLAGDLLELHHVRKQGRKDI